MKSSSSLAIVLLLLALAEGGSSAEGGGGYAWPKDYWYRSTVVDSDSSSHRQDLYVDTTTLNASRASSYEEGGSERSIYAFWNGDETTTFFHEKHAGEEACRYWTRPSSGSATPLSVVPLDDACGPVTAGKGSDDPGIETFGVVCLTGDGEGGEAVTEYAVEWRTDEGFPEKISVYQSSTPGAYRLSSDGYYALSEGRTGLRQVQTIDSHAVGPVDASSFQLPLACLRLSGDVAKARVVRAAGADKRRPQRNKGHGR